MKKVLLLNSLILLLITGAFLGIYLNQRSRNHFYKGNDKRIHFVGRFEFTEDAARVSAPGAYFEFRFDGVRCELKLNDEVLYGTVHNYINIELDGKAYKRIKLDRKLNRIVIYAPSEGIHTIKVSKDTETKMGHLTLLGISCRELLRYKPKKKKLFEFIGDSMTCGNGSDLSSISCEEGEWYDQHNASHSYASLVSTYFDADYRLSAVSGIGVTKSCCGLTKTMPEVYFNTDFNPNLPRLNLQEYDAPDALFFALGQNDGTGLGALFVQTYSRFIKRVSRLYPNAIIVLCSSPMAQNKQLSELNNALQQIKIRLEKSIKPAVYLYTYKSTYRSGCKFHPTLKEHGLMAKELISYLEQQTTEGLFKR